MTVHLDIHNLASATVAAQRTKTSIQCSINFRQRKGNYLQTKTSSSNQKHQQTKDSHSTSKNDKQFTSTSKRSKFVAEEQQSSTISNKSRQDKIKRRVQNFLKFWEIVAAATIGDYVVNPDFQTISSLSNRLLDNKTSMLNSSRCLDFSNGKYM